MFKAPPPVLGYLPRIVPLPFASVHVVREIESVESLCPFRVCHTFPTPGHQDGL